MDLDSLLKVTKEQDLGLSHCEDSFIYHLGDVQSLGVLTTVTHSAYSFTLPINRGGLRQTRIG